MTSPAERAPHGVLIVDKPTGPTSHDVVARARRLLRTRSVGHAGTLDPMASGVLVLLVGEATKLGPWLTAHDDVVARRARRLVDDQDALGRALRGARHPNQICLLYTSDAADEL